MNHYMYNVGKVRMELISAPKYSIDEKNIKSLQTISYKVTYF